METATKLVNPTFVEDLHASREIAKKEFVELKKIDADKQNQEKFQRKKNKEEHMVFNYLWRHFPEIMATKDQDPKLLRQEMGDSEFKKVLKAARKFYGFRAYGSLTVLALGFIGSCLGGTISTSTALISFAITLGIGCVLSVLTCPYYFGPREFNISVYEYDRRAYFLRLHKYSQVK